MGGPEAIVAALVGLAIAQRWAVEWLDLAWLQTWSMVFVSICVQALPFLVGGVLLSARDRRLRPGDATSPVRVEQPRNPYV